MDEGMVEKRRGVEQPMAMDEGMVEVLGVQKGGMDHTEWSIRKKDALNVSRAEALKKTTNWDPCVATRPGYELRSCQRCNCLRAILRSHHR